MDTLEEAILWLVLGVATAPLWGPVLWVLWQGVLRPRLIPRGEVERIATDLLSHHGDRAEEIAFGEEYGAWRHSNPFEQGKWRRVRRRIEASRARHVKA